MGKRKYTLETVKTYFKEQDCELLEDNYQNTNQRLKYKCSCDNISYTIFKSFKKGTRCMNCKGTPKHTYEFVRNFFEKEKCKLLEVEYINSSTKMKYICSCGNESSISFNHFKNGHKCRKCTGYEKLTYEYVYNYFLSYNYKLISKEYISVDDYLEYLCDKEHLCKITFHSFQSGNRCMICFGTPKYTYEYIKSYFEKYNYKLLSNQYKDCFSKLDYICDNNHISNVVFNNFKNGTRCIKCKNKTETIVFNFLKIHFNNVKHQIKFDWCKNKLHLPFDLLIDNIIIEIDGPQHFKQISNWQSPNDTFDVDIYKMKNAIKNNYRIIRIYQYDIFYNKIDWKNKLLEAINSDEEISYISLNKNMYINYQKNIQS